jgi:pyrroloquinoline quinone biosynthesis protein B
MKLFHLPFFILSFCFIIFSCKSEIKQEQKKETYPNQYITILGIAQDAGYPQIDCDKDCCNAFYDGKEPKKLVSCLGLVDLNNDKKWLFDATPDIGLQVLDLKKNHLDNGKEIDGVFLTHAHIGHYTGLMYFGFEALGAKQIPVYAMPRMKTYLEENGPWSQLVSYKNIELQKLNNDSTIILNNKSKITPILVPHRDEYSETIGYKIEGNSKSALFIPDINKWYVWKKDIIEEVKKVDYAFLDASFFKDGEISRPMDKIPHPFTTETTTLFENETKETKAKIFFIHFNHTNPSLLKSHPLKDSIQNLGFNFAKQGDIFAL